jgi:hypothetical protein
MYAFVILRKALANLPKIGCGERGFSPMVPKASLTQPEQFSADAELISAWQ